MKTLRFVQLVVVLLSFAGCEAKDAEHVRSLEFGTESDVKRLFATAQEATMHLQIGSTPDHWALPLHLAVQSGNIAAVEHLLSLGASPTATDYINEDAYVYLSSCEDQQKCDRIVEVLNDAGGDINRIDERGNTPLMTATARGRDKAVRSLMSNGADPDLKNHNGETALKRAEVQLRKDELERVKSALGH